MHLATRQEPPASLVGGRYRLGEQLGEGAAGVVWHARDERLDREVAVKQLVIPSGLAGAEVASRHADAVREGRIAASLDHPGVVAMLDMVVEDGSSWLVMEYVAGSSVAAVLEDGPLGPVEAARIGAAVADALSAAHAVGVVHSDVKPTNVLLAADGTVKLADFGIACAVRDDGMTGPDEVSGTPLFMAPEVARGHRPDAAADVFSLAATVYAMVEGRAPFGSMDSGALAMMHRVAEGTPNPTRRAGPLADVLDALFVLDTDRRPSASMAHGLLAAVSGTPAAAPSDSPDADRPTPRVIVPLRARPAASATTGGSRMVPLTVVASTSSDSEPVTRAQAVPPLTLVQGGAPGALLPEAPTSGIPARGVRAGTARRRRSALLPLSAAGVVALGAVAGTFGAGPGSPLIQSASDLLNRVVGAEGEPVASPDGDGSGARVATEPTDGAPRAYSSVPVAAPPIVPRRAEVVSAPKRHSSGTSSVSSSSRSTSAASHRQLPVDAGVIDDVPLPSHVGQGVVSGVGDTVSTVGDGLSEGVHGVTGGLSDGLHGVTGGLGEGLHGVTGGLGEGLHGVTGGLSDGLHGVTGGLGEGLHGVTGGLSDGLHGVTGGLGEGLHGVTGGLTNGVSGVADGVSGVTGGLANGVSGVTGGLTSTVSGLTGGLTGSTPGTDEHRAGHHQRSGANQRGGSVLGGLPLVGATHSEAEPVTSTVTGLLGSITGSGSDRSTVPSSSTTTSRSTGKRHADQASDGRHRAGLLSFAGAGSEDSAVRSTSASGRSGGDGSPRASGGLSGLTSALTG